MNKADFAAMNTEKQAAGEEIWKNPRNAAGGSLKLLDPREAARRPLKVLLYELLDGERHRAPAQRGAGPAARAGLPHLAPR